MCNATQEGVREELATLLALICSERVSCDSGAGSSSSNSNPYVYIDELKWRAWKMHLTLMLTGDDNKVLRRYCGRVVERMLHKIRLDDVVVSMGAIDKVRQLRTQSAMAAWLSKKMMDSAKRSFFSSKFLFKGLDAYKDAILGKQLDTQMARDVALVRLRPIEISEADGALLRKKARTSVSSKALGKVGSVAVGTVSVAGSVASTAASTAGAAAGFVAQTVADTVQGTPLHAATTAASTAKSAATSAASAAKKVATSGVKAGFKKLGSFFN